MNTIARELWDFKILFPKLKQKNSQFMTQRTLFKLEVHFMLKILNLSLTWNELLVPMLNLADGTAPATSGVEFDRSLEDFDAVGLSDQS